MEENRSTDFSASAHSDYKKPQKEKRGSFNVIDIVLILLLLAFIMIAVYCFAPSSLFDFGSEKTVTVEYTVEIPGVPKDMAAKILVGDSVTDGNAQYALGKVTNTEIDDYVEYIYNDETGRISAVAYSEEGDDRNVLKSVLVTVSTTATYSERYQQGDELAVSRFCRRRAVHQYYYQGYGGDIQWLSRLKKSDLVQDSMWWIF